MRVTSARGTPATGTYKLLVAHAAGWSGEGRVAFSWPDPAAKARATAAAFRRRVADAGLVVDEWLEEHWGVDALHGPTVPAADTSEVPEVLLRMAWRCADRATAARVGRHVVPLALSSPPPGLAGAGRAGTAQPSQLLGLWPTLVDKAVVDAGVRVAVEEV